MSNTLKPIWNEKKYTLEEMMKKVKECGVAREETPTSTPSDNGYITVPGLCLLRRKDSKGTEYKFYDVDFHNGLLFGGENFSCGEWRSLCASETRDGRFALAPLDCFVNIVERLIDEQDQNESYRKALVTIQDIYQRGGKNRRFPVFNTAISWGPYFDEVWHEALREDRGYLLECDLSGKSVYDLAKDNTTDIKEYCDTLLGLRGERSRHAYVNQLFKTITGKDFHITRNHREAFHNYPDQKRGLVHLSRDRISVVGQEIRPGFGVRLRETK